MSERKIVKWITVNGNHIPVYKGETSQDAFNRSVAIMNENKKQSDIEKAKEQADILNGKSESKVNDGMLRILGDSDPRFSRDIKHVAQKMHEEFPEADEIERVILGDPTTMGDVAASMNGLGSLEIRRDIVDNYDSTQRMCKSNADRGYSAGDGTFENSILAHELAHNLDNQLVAVLSHHSPLMNDKPVTVRNENWAYIYSKAFQRDVKVGETLTDIPTSDINARTFEIDGKLYGRGDINTKVSDLIVPLALENVQKNWKSFGYAKLPTKGELVKQLSGYVHRYYYFYGESKDFNTELFAEAYANYISFGLDGNPLALEVMRLTKQLYNSAVSKSDNGMYAFYERYFEAVKDIQEKRKKAGISYD